jgi:predicted  nucleic acid-binding Zn ribbon protein
MNAKREGHKEIKKRMSKNQEQWQGQDIREMNGCSAMKEPTDKDSDRQSGRYKERSGK